MLEIKNLKAKVETDEGGKDILKGLNLEVNPGEVHAIMGPNGSGKSTLASVITGREGYEVQSGEVLFEGKKTFSNSHPRTEREQVSFLHFSILSKFPVYRIQIF